MLITEILKNWLVENNYDGLVNLDLECACTVQDLAPCMEISTECETAQNDPSRFLPNWGCGLKPYEHSNPPPAERKK